MLDKIFGPLEYAVSWVLVTIHSALVGVGLPADSGWSWGPSIVLLVVLVRILLIPLFVKQIRSQRGLQLLQPKMAELRKKYGNDRQKMSEELMKLYKETGTNPFSSCLPILAQSPFFFGLYRTLDGIARNHPERGVLTKELVSSGQSAHIFGAPLPDSFLTADGLGTRLIIVVMIVAMCATQFTTQRQIMLKNMPGGGDNPMAQQQKILLYVFPLVFAVSGVYFPVGVLLYWLTTNLWTMGQQFYVIRNMPAPGSKAEIAMLERKAAKGEVLPAAGAPKGGATAVSAAEVVPPAAPRQQPKKQTRNQRRATPRPPPTAPARTPPAPPATNRPVTNRPAANRPVTQPVAQPPEAPSSS